MSRAWRDGTQSNVAVRAIGPAGSSIRAYFDVRGPGVLVDTYPLNAGGATPRLTPGKANAITIPVTNTGESADVFDFRVARLPEGWTATAATRSLGAGVASTATIEVTPPSSKTAGTYSQSLLIVGRSTTSSVMSTSPLLVTVGPPLPTKGP
jgi:hypothetical protein